MDVRFELNGKKVPLRSLKYKSKDDQLEVMRNWFYENYEDPVESCPYNGREGGYAYIYGGPYDAAEELQTMFEAYVKDDYIEELVDELNFECTEWSRNSHLLDDWFDEHEFDEDLYDAVISSENPYQKFVDNIDSIKTLAKTRNTGEQREHLLGMFYTNVITALETLYVELFIKSMKRDDIYIARCIEKANTQFKVSKTIASMPFKNESIKNIREELSKAITEHLIATSWHYIDDVVKRYKATFEIKVHADWPIDEIKEATQKRNHLVHRGGKDKEGNPVIISDLDLELLVTNAIFLGNKLHESVNTAIAEMELTILAETFKKSEL
ncbi:hypothetical protein [Aeromonas veronii]